MNVLPPRTYGPDAAARQRLMVPDATRQHPAKCHLSLVRDLFLRYTLPGQLVLDPFGGVGSSLLGATLDSPRHVVLVELEPKFCALARATVRHIREHTLPGVPLGRMLVLEGDSRRLPLQTAADAVLSSPPYANLASRNRSAEPYSLRKDPALRAQYGTAAANRHIDGYGRTPGQIGAMAGATYASAVLQVYRECYRVVRPGGLLVLVTGNLVRHGRLVDLAAESIALAQAAGWTPVERWQHRKRSVSFWRHLQHQQGKPAVTHEDVLVFCKGPRPGWPLAPLPPTTRAPVSLSGAGTAGVTQPALPWDHHRPTPLSPCELEPLR